MPRFLYDVFLLWSTHGIILLAKGLILDRMRSEDAPDRGAPFESYLAATVNFLLASTMYPFHVVSTVMACNGTSAASINASALNPELVDWTEAWKHLSSLGQLKRGSSLLWRYQTTGFASRPLVFTSFSSPIGITRVKNVDSWRPKGCYNSGIIIKEL